MFSSKFKFLNTSASHILLERDISNMTETVYDRIGKKYDALLKKEDVRHNRATDKIMVARGVALTKATHKNFMKNFKKKRNFVK